MTNSWRLCRRGETIHYANVRLPDATEAKRHNLKFKLTRRRRLRSACGPRRAAVRAVSNRKARDCCAPSIDKRGGADKLDCVF
jgi:hypothetical protein